MKLFSHDLASVHDRCVLHVHFYVSTCPTALCIPVHIDPIIAVRGCVAWLAYAELLGNALLAACLIIATPRGCNSRTRGRNTPRSQVPRYTGCPAQGRVSILKFHRGTQLVGPILQSEHCRHSFSVDRGIFVFGIAPYRCVSLAIFWPFPMGVVRFITLGCFRWQVAKAAWSARVIVRYHGGGGLGSGH